MSKIKIGLGLGAGLVLAVAALNVVLGITEPNNFDPEGYKQTRQQYSVVIKRDTWGVPHIEGVTDADAAFGFAFAQAEDHYKIIEGSMRFYRGKQSAKMGMDTVPLDYLVQLLEITSNVEAKYDTALTPEIKAVMVAFVDGLNYWAALNPEAVDQHMLPYTAKDLAASFSLQHLLFYGLQGPIQELFKDQRQRHISLDSNATAWQLVDTPPLPTGSNAYAISPARSDDGSTRLLINSHQPLTGPVAWYEAHVKSQQGWNMTGGSFPGSPIISVGTNEHVAWGATVNKPDLVDIYVLEINPDNDNQYKLDGQWRDFVIKQATIRIKLLGNLYWTVQEDLFYSEHGPVVRRDHGDYAIRYAGHGEIRQADQWFAMNKATSLESWEQAMDQLAMSSFNFVAADENGNIGFYHNSQSPIRQPGWDWQQYLPGDRSELIWDEYLPFAKLPQVTNPASGYVLSVNQSPFHVTGEADNPLRTDFSETFGFPTRMTNRATRGLELFAAKPSMNQQQFEAIKYDNSYSKNSRAITYLRDLYAVEYEVDSRYQQAQQHLKNWDLSTDVSSRAAGLGVCTISGEWLAEQAGTDAPSVKDEFEKCVDLLFEKHATVDLPWGDINRLVRGDKKLAVNGGPDVLRAIYGVGLEEDGYLSATGGDGLYLFVSWDKDGVQTVKSIHQFGSATLDENSKHFDDQMPLYIDEKLKSVFFAEGELAGNIEREYEP